MISTILMMMVIWMTNSKNLISNNPSNLNHLKMISINLMFLLNFNLMTINREINHNNNKIRNHYLINQIPTPNNHPKYLNNPLH